MITKDISDISGSDIEQLVSNSSSESMTLEFKRSLPGTTDMDKKEFLADISAFSNTLGGDLIFGLEESDGCAKALCGIDASSIDNELLRMESLIHSGIEPRIRYRAAIIDCSGKKILLFRMEKSWNAPHRVTLKGHDKFYGRNSAGKFSLDVQQLRNAFLENSSIVEKLRDFRTARLIEIISGRIPVEMDPGSRLVLHLLPIESFASHLTHDVEDTRSNYLVARPMNVSAWNERFTLEGKLFYSQYGTKPSASYMHLYRNGIIEAVEGTVLNHILPNGAKNIPSVAYEQIILENLQRYLKLLLAMSVHCPIAIALSLTGVKGSCIGLNHSSWDMPELRPVIQEHLFLPEVMLQNFDDSATAAIRPSFDLVWNACGLPKSRNFDSDGEWKPPRWSPY